MFCSVCVFFKVSLSKGSNTVIIVCRITKMTLRFVMEMMIALTSWNQKRKLRSFLWPEERRYRKFRKPLMQKTKGSASCPADCLRSQVCWRVRGTRGQVHASVSRDGWHPRLQGPWVRSPSNWGQMRERRVLPQGAVWGTQKILAQAAHGLPGRRLQPVGSCEHRSFRGRSHGNRQSCVWPCSLLPCCQLARLQRMLCFLMPLSLSFTKESEQVGGGLRADASLCGRWCGAEGRFGETGSGMWPARCVSRLLSQGFPVRN